MLILLTCGCTGREDLDGKRRTPRGSAKEKTIDPTIVMKKSELYYDLYALRPMMYRHRGGSLVINAGSADFWKYIDGGIGNDWFLKGELSDANGITHRSSQVKGLAAILHFPADLALGGIQTKEGKVMIRLRAMSASTKQWVSVFLNYVHVGDIRMPTTNWADYKISANKELLVQGENTLRFYFRHSTEIQGVESAAAITRIGIGAWEDNHSDALEVGQKTGKGGRQRGLSSTGPARISQYLLIPPEPSRYHALVLSQRPASIVAHVQGQKSSQELWQTDGSEGWQDVQLDLTSLAGKFVRLDCLSEGASSWAKMQIRSRESKSKQDRLPRLEPDHIVFWSVASLRPDRLVSAVAPTMKRFLKKSFSVPEAFSTAVFGAGGHVASMTGRMQTMSSIPQSYYTLAEVFRERGYSTGLFSGNGRVADSAGYAQGFDVYDNPKRRRHYYGARALWRQARRFLLKRKKQKTFVYIATVEPQIPYRPSAKSLQKFWKSAPPFSAYRTLALSDLVTRGKKELSLSEKSYVRALYDASVADADIAFGTMLEELKEIGLDGRVAIILHSDHGEELWERGRFGHGVSLHQEALKIPFAIQMEGLDRKAPKRASSVDFYVTLLDLIGEKPRSEARGKSLLNKGGWMRTFASAAKGGARSIIWGDYKLIIDKKGKVAVFNLSSDVSELSDISSQFPLLVRTLRTALATSIAFESVWSTARWGDIVSPTEAFAREQGM